MNYNYNKSNKILYCINCNKKGHHQKKMYLSINFKWINII